jgi:arginase
VKRRVHLIGAPTDVGAGTVGARMGPDALRVAGLRQAIEALGLPVHDAGNLAGPTLLTNPDNPAGSPTPAGSTPPLGYRHLAEVQAWCVAVHDAVQRALAAGDLPLVMGGDHSLAIGSVSAVARHARETGHTLRVLWLDAHADFNTPELTPSGNLHGMPVAMLCGHGPPALTRLARAWQPGSIEVPAAIDAAALRLIGIRSVDPGERRFIHDEGLQVFDMRHIDEHGMRATMALALAGVDDRTHLHVSLDLDFLDPEIAPGVGTPVRGGPTWREAQLAMEMIADTGRLASLDIMELDPSRDVRNGTAQVAVELVESLLGRRTLMG